MLTDALSDTTLGDALDLARRTWPALGIWPDAVLPHALAGVEALLSQAEAAGAHNLGWLQGARERRVLAAVARSVDSGRDDEDDKAMSARTNALHGARNVHVALRCTTALTLLAASRGRLRIGSYTHGLKPLQPRSRLSHRPLTDDEAALLRLSAEAEAILHNHPGPVLAALGLAGLAQAEATQARIEDLSHDAWDIAARGCGGANPRSICLPPWSQRITAEAAQRMIATGYAPHALLAYTGHATPGKNKATATASQGYKRLLDRVGLTGPDLTPRSVSLWRPNHLIRVAGDLPAALHVAGRALENLLHALGLTVDEALLHIDRCELRDWQDAVIATVPTQQILLRPRRRRDAATRRTGRCARRRQAPAEAGHTQAEGDG